MPLFRPRWRFLHIDSRTMAVKAPLPEAKSKNLTLTHNRPGSASFSHPMESPEMDDLNIYTSGIMAVRQNSMGAWKYIWSGQVTDIDEQWDTGQLSVQADGWLQFLQRRFLRRVKNYTANNALTSKPWLDAEIIFDIVSEMNNPNITWQIDAAGNPITYTIPSPYLYSGARSGASAQNPTPIWIGDTVGTTFRPSHERKYQLESGAEALGSIQSLTDIENGCDIRVDPVTRELSVYDSYGKNSKAVFGYNVMPNNMRTFGRHLISDDMINFMRVTSAGPSVIPQYADTQGFPDPTQNPPKLGENSMKYYGLLEEEQSIAVGAGGVPAATMQAFAGAEVLIRSSPRVVYAGLPVSFGADDSAEDSVGNVPEPFEDYEIGDTVYLNAKRGRRAIKNQAVRLFGITVDPDDNNGTEVISNLQISL